MLPPLRWQAGKVWQGMGSAVRPRSWWILASRPSAPWLLTGIPDAIAPLSSRSTLPGPSVLPFQARAPSSTSAGMTRRAQCLHRERASCTLMHTHSAWMFSLQIIEGTEGPYISPSPPLTLTGGTQYCHHPFHSLVPAPAAENYIYLLLPNTFPWSERPFLA